MNQHELMALGREAHQRGEHISDCPFAPGLPEHRHWARGWLDQESLRQVFSGELHERSRRMAEEASLKEYAAKHVETDTDRYLAQFEEPKPEKDLWPSKIREMTSTFSVCTAGTLWIAPDPVPITGYTITYGVVDPEPPHTIRGKPAPRPRARVCPRHGNAMPCRICWR